MAEEAEHRQLAAAQAIGRLWQGEIRDESRQSLASARQCAGPPML
jgi:hypothetical protein